MSMLSVKRKRRSRKVSDIFNFSNFSVDTIPNFLIIEDEHLGSGYQWLAQLSQGSTVGALVPQVMESNEVLKKYAAVFSMANMQKWYKTLSKGMNI